MCPNGPYCPRSSATRERTALERGVAHITGSLLESTYNSLMTSGGRIIIDCDPGQDDAVMLLFALAARDELDIAGITTVAGNVPLQLTQRNARLVCELAGVEDVPVMAGHAQPLRRALMTAESVHGQDGIDGMTIREPRLPLDPRHAVEFIVETLRASEPGSVTLVPTGPLTNIADALRRAPELVDHVQRIVLMGGAMREAGNMSPSAEFNILVDPDAADIVLRCGRPIVMAGLDVTHQVIVRPDWVARLRALGTRVAEETAGMLEFFNRHDSEKYQAVGAPLHDPCTIAWLLQPDLFEARMVNVRVETESELTLGHTAVDFWNVTGLPPNVLWLHRVDAERFFALLLEKLSRYED